MEKIPPELRRRKFTTFSKKNQYGQSGIVLDGKHFETYFTNYKITKRMIAMNIVNGGTDDLSELYFGPTFVKPAVSFVVGLLTQASSLAPVMITRIASKEV